MPLHFRILGQPQEDNAVYLVVNTGNETKRFLFDLGQNTLDSIPLNELYQLDGVFFSHLHMDHLAGFDSFFRVVHQRTSEKNCFWGPEGSHSILLHRLRGYQWNLAQEESAEWQIIELLENQRKHLRAKLCDGFSETKTWDEKQETNFFVQLLLESKQWKVEAFPLEHGIPSMAYKVSVKPQEKICMEKVDALGLTGGSWMIQLKNPQKGEKEMQQNGKSYSWDFLRKELLETTSGESFVYMTDFRFSSMTEAKQHSFLQFLQGSQSVVCECQYLHKDRELAQKNFHMTSKEVGRLASLATIEELTLFHFSKRYSKEDCHKMFLEVKSEFPNVRLSADWQSFYDS